MAGIFALFLNLYISFLVFMTTLDYKHILTIHSCSTFKHFIHLTSTANLESRMSLECGQKPKYLEETSHQKATDRFWNRNFPGVRQRFKLPHDHGILFQILCQGTLWPLYDLNI